MNHMNRPNLSLVFLVIFASAASAENELTAKCSKFLGFEFELSPETHKRFEDNETLFSFSYSPAKNSALMFQTSATFHGDAPHWEKLKILQVDPAQITAIEINLHSYSIYTLIPKENVVYISSFVHLSDPNKGQGSTLKAECKFSGSIGT